METINDVSNFLNKLEVDVYTTMEGNEELLTNLFQHDNSEKLESILQNVKEIEILYLAGDWKEISDVVKILRKDIKILRIQM